MEKIKFSEEQAKNIRARIAAKIAMIHDDEEDNEYWKDYEEDMIIEQKKERLWMN